MNKKISTDHLVAFVFIFFLAQLMFPVFAPAQTSEFGAGVVLGYPNAVSARLVMSKKTAMVCNVSWNPLCEQKMYAGLDLQFLQTVMMVDEIDDSRRELSTFKPYWGLGLKAGLADNADNELTGGIRMGGGMEFAIKRFGLFFELYPSVNVVPDFGFIFEGGIGLRYYLLGKRDFRPPGEGAYE